MEQDTILIVSDDAEFSRAITGRWQSERTIPTFTLVSGDLCQELDDDAFQLAIVGAVKPEILQALDTTNPVILICENPQALREARKFRPHVAALQRNEGWLDTLVLVASQALRRVELERRLQLSKQENEHLRLRAALGTYMRDMMHNMNNALTSVLGNSELMLLDADSLSAASCAQVETIRNMALRMHEILHRFSSIEKELKVVATQSENHTLARASGE